MDYKLDAMDHAPPEVREMYHRCMQDPKLFETQEFMDFAKEFRWFWPIDIAHRNNERRKRREAEHAALEETVADLSYRPGEWWYVENGVAVFPDRKKTESDDLT